MSSETDSVEQFMMGLIAALLTRPEARTILKQYTVDRTEYGDALVLHFPDTWNTYRIKVEFVGNIQEREDAQAEASK